MEKEELGKNNELENKDEIKNDDIVEKENIENEEINLNHDKKQIKISLVGLILVIILVICITLFAKSVISNKRNSSSKEMKFNENIYERPAEDFIGYKPIIYIYPEKEKEVSVKLGRPESLITTYPKYNEEGWKVMANPDGTLTDCKTGRELYALYWEGKLLKKYNNDFKEGFVVSGEETAEFLEEKLDILGLNEREAEEFIVYWLPQMEDNRYNYIRFQTMEEINENMPLEIEPSPETLIRVMMEWKKLDKEIVVKEQKLEKAERKGYTVIEWGGTKIDSNEIN